MSDLVFGLESPKKQAQPYAAEAKTVHIGDLLVNRLVF